MPIRLADPELLNRDRLVPTYVRVQFLAVAYPGILFGGGRGGVQQIQLRAEDRENGNLGTVAL
jgi:hypothetical protein